ncbi:MAG: hypothetical protein JWQ49_4475 [Edaphobacter sp.]|nr:hypothetical protein [Edaphobacter sp.]
MTLAMKTEETRQKLIESAGQIFAEVGYNAPFHPSCEREPWVPCQAEAFRSWEHILQYAERQCVLGVDGAARQAAINRAPAEHQGRGGDLDTVGRDSNHDQLAANCEAVDKCGNRFAAWSGCQDRSGAAHSL